MCLGDVGCCFWLYDKGDVICCGGCCVGGWFGVFGWVVFEE